MDQHFQQLTLVALGLLLLWFLPVMLVLISLAIRRNADLPKSSYYLAAFAGASLALVVTLGVLMAFRYSRTEQEIWNVVKSVWTGTLVSVVIMGVSFGGNQFRYNISKRAGELGRSMMEAQKREKSNDK